MPRPIRAARTPRRIRRPLAPFVSPLASSVSPLGWTVTGSGAAALAAFVPLGWHELLAYGVAALSMMLVSVVMSLGNTSFRAAIDLRRRRVTVGDTASVRVDIGNPGRTPTTAARGDLPIGSRCEWFTIPPLAPGGSRRTDIEFHTPRRTVIAVGPLRIRKGDPFGLIRRERRLTDGIDLFVHPVIVPLEAPDAGSVRDLEGSPSDDTVDDDLDFHGLREYAPGDDVRNVHWPSTAKTGALMIRRYEATRRTDTALTMSVDPDEYAGPGEFELAVSVHASVGARCLARRRPLSTHAGAAHAAPRRATDFLDSCSRIVPDRSDDPNLARGTLEHAPDVSFYILTVGSLRDADGIGRMASALPESASTLVLQVAEGMPRAIRRFPGFTLATVGGLDDLPIIMGVLA